MLASHSVSDLFRKYSGDLLKMVSSRYRKSGVEAEDVIQDAFHNFLKIEEPDKIENPKAYLFRTANNLALSRIRKHEHHLKYVHETESNSYDERTPERAAAGQKDLDALQVALNRLPLKYQKPFFMSRIESKTYREIALELGISESTVEKRMIKVLKCLRDELVCEESV